MHSDLVRSVSRTHQRNRDCGPTTPRQPKCKHTRVCVAQCVCARVSSACAGPRSDTVLTSRQDVKLRGIPMPRSSSGTMTGSASCASAQGARRRGWRKQLVLPSIVLSASCCRIFRHPPSQKKREHNISRSDVVEVGDRITRRSVDGAGRGRSVDIQANRDQPLCCQLRCGCRGGKHRRSSFSRPCRALAPPSSSDKDGNKVLWAAAGAWEPGVALVFRVLGSHYCVIGVGRFSGRITFPRYRRVATARSVNTRFCSSVPAAP